MNTQRVLFKWLAVVILTALFFQSTLILPSVSAQGGNTPTPTGTPFACSSWNLANDFRISPNQENPNRDSCNNLGVWEFMASTSLTRDPATYYPLSIFTPAVGNYPGLDFWFGTIVNGNGQFPAIGFNGSGAMMLTPTDGSALVAPPLSSSFTGGSSVLDSLALPSPNPAP